MKTTPPRRHIYAANKYYNDTFLDFKINYEATSKMERFVIRNISFSETFDLRSKWIISKCKVKIPLDLYGESYKLITFLKGWIDFVRAAFRLLACVISFQFAPAR